MTWLVQARSVIAPSLRSVICCEKGQQSLLLGSVNASVYQPFCKGHGCLLLEGELVSVEGGAAVANTGMGLSLVESKCTYSVYSLVTVPLRGVDAFPTVVTVTWTLWERVWNPELKEHLSEKGLHQVKNWVLGSILPRMCWVSLGELLHCSELSGHRSHASFS